MSHNAGRKNKTVTYFFKFSTKQGLPFENYNFILSFNWKKYIYRFFLKKNLLKIMPVSPDSEKVHLDKKRNEVLLVLNCYYRVLRILFIFWLKFITVFIIHYFGKLIATEINTNSFIIASREIYFRYLNLKRWLLELIKDS